MAGLGYHEDKIRATEAQKIPNLSYCIGLRGWLFTVLAGQFLTIGKKRDMNQKKHWLSGGVATLGATFALPVQTEAAVIYHGTTPVTVSWLGGSSSLLHPRGPLNPQRPTDDQGRLVRNFQLGNLGINLNPPTDALGDNINDFNIGGSSSGFGSTGNAHLQGLLANQAIKNGSNQLKRLNFGDTIPGAAPFAGGILNLRGVTFLGQTGSWNKSVTGVAGVKFDIGGLNHYGWIRLVWKDTVGNPNIPNSITAIDWAYNDIPDAPIVIPEASTGLSLLATAGAALSLWRRKQRGEAVAS